MGRGEINGAGNFLAVDDEFDSAGEVGFVNPRNILAAIALCSAEAEADQPREHGEDAAGFGSKDERSAERDLARARRFAGEEGGLPIFNKLNGPVPFLRSAAAR